MIPWLLKKLYAAVDIRSGQITYSFSKIPRGFINDLKDILKDDTEIDGLIYIKMKRNKAHLFFSGNFSSGVKQRILNCWVMHKDKYK